MSNMESGDNMTSPVEQYIETARLAEEQLDRWTAIVEYRKAFLHANNDENICFRLAYNLDLVGEEDEALSLYEQCCESGPAKINALINLAVLYEDRGQFVKAEKCLRQVLETNPSHERAKLFMKDVQASKEMYYAEDQQWFHDRQTAMYEMPITDFELTMRARNCLHKMDIHTLGDLLRTSEPELMSYKNFGDTTLMEIRSMLAQKGMKLGQNIENRSTAVRDEIYAQLVADGKEVSMDASISELNLSVRANKALEMLNITMIVDLISHTEAELLGIKNFGATSLDEIKERLTDRGLSLRQLD